MEQARPAKKVYPGEDASDGSGSSSLRMDLTEESEEKTEADQEVLAKLQSHPSVDLKKEIDEEETEFQLERLLEEGGSHKFYCPTCKACIDKIIMVRGGRAGGGVGGVGGEGGGGGGGGAALGEDREVPGIKCPNCCTFLVVIGNALTSICNPSTEPPGTYEARDSKKLEILKSIVYGGLLESIASLNIVTSAAGADATALNILALGLANLVGGLSVIGRNLIELRKDNQGGGNEEERRDGYEEELGKRQNFKLHATVAVISFLLFGLVAPVTYGFSFLKSGNKDLKLAAVAAASLLCIAVLAIGKAYIQKASGFYGYIKTVLSFLIPGFAASGVSYAVGDLIKKLMEKLGLFDSAAAPAFTLSSPQPGWVSSY